MSQIYKVIAWGIEMEKQKFSRPGNLSLPTEFKINVRREIKSNDGHSLQNVEAI